MRNEKRNTLPPSWANRFLEWYCHEDLIDEIQGDLFEQFQTNCTSHGTKSAKWRFVLDVFRFFRPSSFKRNRIGMNTQIIRNYVKVSFRVLKREKAYTLTNVFGLTLGITCSLFIFLWVQDELKYNRWPDDMEKIHFVQANNTESSGLIRTWQGMPWRLKEVLQNEYPSIELSAVMDWGSTHIFKKGETFLEAEGIHGSAELFDIFSIPFIHGSHQPLFDHPNSIAISEIMAERYFGSDWQEKGIIGKEIAEKGGDDFILAGVFQNISNHSTLNFEFVIPFSYRLKKKPWLEQWGNFSNKIFVKIADGYNTISANQNTLNAITEKREESVENDTPVVLQPFADLHLYNRFENGKVSGGRIDYINLLSVSALLIIILASVNFMNLTTAKSIKRSKETGVRKVLGAMKSSVRLQFIIEATMVTFCSYLISILLLIFLLPDFNELVGKEIGLGFFTPEFILTGTMTIFLIGVLSGLYPAIYMSSLNPISSMRGLLTGKDSNALFRKGLVIAQFVITIVMITGSISIYKQLQFIFNKNIGLNRENVIMMELGNIHSESKLDIYKEKLVQSSGIETLSAINEIPFQVGNSTSDPEWDGKDETQDNNFYILAADPNFIPTLKVSLIAGRNFDWKLQSDTSNYIINQTAANLMGLENPIGISLEFWENKGKIIGLIEDFHTQSLHNPMEPLIIRYDPKETWRALIKTKKGQTQAAIASLERLHNEFNPERNFDFEFLDENYNKRYKSEQMVSQFSLYFTVVAITICCLGLLSLVAFKTTLKTKEIGIRKVLGASIASIINLIGKEFLMLALISFLIAVPLAYWVISDWLDEFAYSIKIDVWLFVFAGLAVLIITIITITNHALRSALRNPVESLRDE